MKPKTVFNFAELNYMFPTSMAYCENNVEFFGVEGLPEGRIKPVRLFCEDLEE
jgi:hypothetical protein